MRLMQLGAIGAVMTATMLLAACGNDSDNHASNNGGGNNVSPDSFVAAVRTQTDTPIAMLDDSEPVDIVTVVETAPDDREPETVTF